MPSSATKTNEPTQQDVCIDLPGETVQCWRSSDKIRVILRKHRDVFFDLNLLAGATYTVESGSDFYCLRDKKLLRRVEFKDGERLNVWVGRDFKGVLVLKASGRTMGSYEVNRLDTKSYGGDPKNKPEPLMIVMGKRDASGSSMCTAQDPFGIGTTQQLLKPSFDPKLSMLKDFGTGFEYTYPLEPPEVIEYVAVTEAQAHEIQPQVIKQLDNGIVVTGTADQIFVPPKKGDELSPLYRGLAAAAGYISHNDFLTSNSFKETAGYFSEHFGSLNRITMKVYIEKKAKGKYKIALKGRPLTAVVGNAFGESNKAKVLHEKISLGSKRSAFLDGHYARTGKAGYGGVKRITLTTAKNFLGGMKIQVIGTVIDIIGDVNTVYFDEKGSKDFSEFLGRAGVSIAKAGATAAIGSLFAAVGVAAVTAVFAAAGVAAAPVIVVVGAVIAGYIIAATIVDKIDEKFGMKEGVARWAY